MRHEIPTQTQPTEPDWTIAGAFEQEKHINLIISQQMLMLKDRNISADTTTDMYV